MGLKKRGNQHWFKLAIPKPLQRYFLSSKGKPLHHIEEPLGDSLSVAKVKAAQRHAVCVALFARLRAGERMTPEQAKAALRGSEDMDQDQLDRAIWESLGGSKAIDGYIEKRNAAIRAAIFEAIGSVRPPGLEQPAPAPATGETISQAAEAWIAELKRQDKPPQPATIDGHRKRVKAFVDKHGDLPLTEITRAMAFDFLASLNVRTGTRNAYATTLRCVFESAKEDRGRFTGDNPFNGMKKKAKGDSYVPFTVAELQTLFNALPRNVAPAKHSPETALPWVALIALYTGMRLEEIAQLTTADIREEGTNGATVWVIDIHNGGTNKLKNETSARLVPVHFALVQAGLLDYVKALKAGPLFPGLTRRASKGGKVGARLGELFRKLLVRLGLKRAGLCFHSFRHTVGTGLDVAGVAESDSARILGHAQKTQTRGTYSKGPGLVRLKVEVDKIVYEGLTI